MRLKARIKREVKFLKGLTQRFRVDLPHDRADELLLSPPGLLVLQGVEEADGLDQILVQAQPFQLFRGQVDEALPEFLKSDHVPLALRFTGTSLPVFLVSMLKFSHCWLR